VINDKTAFEYNVANIKKLFIIDNFLKKNFTIYHKKASFRRLMLYLLMM